MKPESLVQLVASGNAATIEVEWMRLIEAQDLPLGQLANYKVVLAELVKVRKASMAEELAWAAIEAISARQTPQETLELAGPFLLAVGESDELRGQVVELYKTAYADREGLEELLAEAGLGGGRPVRRALRTLEVCLALMPGDYLVSRDGTSAARIEQIDTSSWRFAVTSGAGTETLDAVRLADVFRPAQSTEFSVARVFAPDQLTKRLWDDPVPVVIEICKQRDGQIDSDSLEALLVRELLPEADWKKWWSRARTAVKKCPNLKITGRSPCILSHVDEPIPLDEEILSEFESVREPLGRFELVEKYLRECRTRGEKPSQSALLRCYESLNESARKVTEEGAVSAGLLWVIARRVGEAAGVDGVPEELVAFFRGCGDLKAVFGLIEDESLLDLACGCLAEARAGNWQEQLAALLPTVPLASCDRIAERLSEAGWGPDEFEPIVQHIMSQPLEHFEAMLWLWNGPTQREKIPAPSPVTVLSRILRTLDECRRSDKISSGTVKKVAARARSVLAARKYQRFESCLDGLESGMAGALRTQIRRNDGLGRAGREDMIKRLGNKFPLAVSGAKIEPWELEDVLCVTEQGFAKKQEEIEYHVNVTMKKNAEAIGRAAAHGDLSENSEYKFALEERDLLRARLAQMNAEMAQARVYSAAAVPTDHVGIGTKVVFRRIADGDRYEMTFISSWEADAEKAWFNYKAPIAAKILGKTVGDAVEFNHSGVVGKYEIVELLNALAEDG